MGTYERETQKQVTRHLKRGEVFYDVGANVGFYSLLAAALVEPGRVYAFEPLPTNLTYLRKHLALNGIDNVEIVDTAISNEVGTASFECEETRAMGRLCVDGGVRVRTSTLDSLITERRTAPPNCIKMDIEGGEFRALLGARECFAQCRPKLFLATHGRDVRDECCRLLQSWNYELQPSHDESKDLAELFAYPKAESHDEA
jgi:FkbM family methyltransferase